MALPEVKIKIDNTKMILTPTYASENGTLRKKDEAWMNTIEDI